MDFPAVMNKCAQKANLFCLTMPAHKIAILGGALVRSTGRSEGPILVLLHGFADSGLMFVPLFDTPLARDFELLAVDLPGFGASPWRDGVGTVAEYAQVLVKLVAQLAPNRDVCLVVHSVASMIGVEAAAVLGERLTGLFSIEGNLTADDAYFSGKAANHDEPLSFKQTFLDEIWAMATSRPILRRYHAAAMMADAQAMWSLGRDVRRLSLGDAPGRAYSRVLQPSLYYWSRQNTPVTTATWIDEFGIMNIEFAGASHWPTIDRPIAVAETISTFFRGLLKKIALF